MKSKQKMQPVYTLLALFSSVTMVLACTSGPKSGAVCGQSQPATPNACEEINCSTKAETCSGSSNYYICNTVNYTASCSTIYYTLYIGYHGEGIVYCGTPGAPGANEPAACQTTQSLGPGCL